MKPAAILRSIMILAVLGMASLACSTTSGPPKVGNVVVAKNLDADYKPVDPTSVYSTEETFYISVQVTDLVAGSVVKVDYILDGKVIKDSSLTADKPGSGYYGFQLSSDSGQAPGNYTAEVYLDGVLAKTVAFTVDASTPPTILDVVAAKSMDGLNKPVRPTSKFNSIDTFYISVQVKNLAVGSVVDVKYKLDGSDYHASTLTADQSGSGYYGFSLTPPTGGHAPGNYSVETYLNGTLVKTIEFTVVP